MNDLFEEMKVQYEAFCYSAQRFIDAYQEAQQEQQPVQEEPDYKSWIGKVVYVWDNDPDYKQKAILLEYRPNYRYPFGVAGANFQNAELCEDE